MPFGLGMISLANTSVCMRYVHFRTCGWFGRAMVLGRFQCRAVLLLWHMVGQGPAVLAADAGWVLFLIFFHLVYPVFLF